MASFYETQGWMPAFVSRSLLSYELGYHCGAIGQIGKPLFERLYSCSKI